MFSSLLKNTPPFSSNLKFCQQTLSVWKTMFSTLLKTNFNFWVTFILLSANAFNLDQPKILLFGKALTLDHTIHKLIKILKKMLLKTGCKEDEMRVTNLSDKSSHLTLSQTSPGFYMYAEKVFRKYCGKRQNCL